MANKRLLPGQSINAKELAADAAAVAACLDGPTLIDRYRVHIEQ